VRNSVVRAFGYFFMAQTWGFFATVVTLVPIGVLIGAIFGNVDLFGELNPDGVPVLIFYWLISGYVFFVMPLGLISQWVLGWIFTIRSFQSRYANGPIARNTGSARNPIFEPVTQTPWSSAWTTIGNLGWLPNRYTFAGGMLGGAVWLFLLYLIPHPGFGSLERSGFAVLSVGLAALAAWLWIRGVRVRLGLIEAPRRVARVRKTPRQRAPADPSDRNRPATWHRSDEPKPDPVKRAVATRARKAAKAKPAASTPKPPPPRYPAA